MVMTASVRPAARVRKPRSRAAWQGAAGRRRPRAKDARCSALSDPASLRTLALRSDMTPQVGRIASTSLKDAPRPLRLAYCGDTALIRASQLDPARERLQLGAELIGADSVAAASEAVMLAVEALGAAGLTGISVDFTLPDLVDTLSVKAFPLAPDQIPAVRRELDTKRTRAD